MIKLLFNIPSGLKKILILFLDIFFSFISLATSIIILELYFEFGIFYIFLIFSFLLPFLYVKIYSEFIRFSNFQNFINIFKLLFINSLILFFITFLIYGFRLELIKIILVYKVFFFFFIILSRLFIVFTYENLKFYNKKNIIIYGAGEAGLLAFNNLKKYSIKAFIDDDINKIGRYIQSVPVINKIDLVDFLKKDKIHYIVVAIPSLENSGRADILEKLNKYKIEIKMLPKIDELLLGNFDFNKFSILPSDLIKRDIKWNKDKVYEVLNDKVVLVTGGGGSLGSSLVKKIINANIKKLIIIDNNEFNLFKIVEEVTKLINFFKIKNKFDYKLISINDNQALEQIFKVNKPNIVFHAGAYKHVNLLENNIYSAFKNNIIGSYNIINCSIVHNCESFIFISTDKAVNPSSIMGKTKRLIENYISYIQKKYTNTSFSVVRFGNVINSNGSVIPIFENQIINKQPITITHPDVTRFFMSIDEAINLVLETLILKNKNVIYVLNMGKPIKIIDIAKKLISIYGLKIKKDNNSEGDIEIKYIGLRDGEKLHEELFYKNAKKITLNENINYEENDIDIGLYENFEKDILNLDHNISDSGIINLLNKYI